MNKIAEEILMHYGMPRRSGRYPWGSGDDPYQRSNRDFLGRIEELKKTGWTESAENIKKEFGCTIKEYRSKKANAINDRRIYEVETAKALKKDGLNNREIGDVLGKNESTIRNYFNEDAEARMREAKNTADFLKARSLEKGMLDVGIGVEKELNISRERLDQALQMLKDRDGYEVYNGRFPQVTNPNQWTTQKVLCPPGTPNKDIYKLDEVHTITDYVSHDDGKTFDTFVYPKSMNSNRLKIRYAEEGGIDKDGIVEIRRGVDDLSLGEAHYSQVRILVDDKKFIKGMAVYSDDMPDGVDVIFNTNKPKSTGKLDVLKDIKNDPDNPFGSLIKAGGQSYYIDKDGNKQLSLINKRADEGDWSDWKDALPSQFLGKQPISMIKKQLNLAKADKLAEYDEICSLTNPTVKKHMLQKFADECDAAAVHLKAAALPGQKYHVIIPVNSLKDNEVYAPNYKDGTQVALIRYPHGGTFEIPILTVNNKHAPARKLIGTDTIDAIGITKNNADRLSGADFDGDTVMVIPTHDPQGKVKIKSTPSLQGLEGFDPKMSYPERKGMQYMRNTQTQMGVISNLITDMTLVGADKNDIAAAVRHSMVVIDAEKHKLDYKRSEVENNVSALKKKYQITIDENGNEHYGGASTILSRSKGQTSVPKRQGTPNINIKGKPWYDPDRPEGALIYKEADDIYKPVRTKNNKTGIVTLTTVDGKKIKYDPSDGEANDKYRPIKKIDSTTGEITYTNKDGDISYRLEKRTQKSTRMAETDDAYTLVSASRNPKELVYADYANSIKALANQARKELVSTGKIEYSSAAKEVYQTEVNSLMDKLHKAELNTTRERAAQRMANYEVNAKKLADPDMKKEDIKKASQQALTKSRASVGSITRKNRNIEITDREWEAIQAGAISENKLKRILNNTDTDLIRERAMPRSTTSLSSAQISRIKALSASNYTIGEIAEKMGKSPATISKYLKGVN